MVYVTLRTGPTKGYDAEWCILLKDTMVLFENLVTDEQVMIPLHQITHMSGTEGELFPSPQNEDAEEKSDFLGEVG